MEYQSLGTLLRNLLMVAWLLPLAGFAVEIFGGWWSDRKSKAAAFLAVGCIATGFVCSAIALVTWGVQTEWGRVEIAGAAHHSVADEHADANQEARQIEAMVQAVKRRIHPSHPGELTFVQADVANDHASAVPQSPVHADGDVAQHAAKEHGDHHHAAPMTPFTGAFYTLGRFGDFAIGLDWYIDSLTLVMFTMVTLIATCIHVFALGYMRDELTDDYEDHEIHLPGGRHFHRPGRYHRFFAFMSLFCFSMLGLVIAGNIFMVFVFWELVGICSYFLIGFYTERRSASNAANKAFIMNRVGDFGFLIGLMILLTWFGTFRFVEPEGSTAARAGLFQQVRDGHGALVVASDDELAVVLHDAHGHALAGDAPGGTSTIPYWLLVAAGLGIFAGCIGKSAQFPLQTWLPDAMEGPTPVSALVHSATMVAAGVYLAGRFYPMFTPEVLLVIAYVGCVTLFVAATIAVVATDIKRVLAFSTISQLGYMMLAIGVAGWGAGLFHLVTHAFFKSLMFLAAGSVIVACHHVQEMPRMGGLWRKMPITAFTMLAGVIAISGLALPGINIWGHAIAFSGFHSKDAIVATALAHSYLNPLHFLLFLVPLVTAGITAFYMFRLWFFTFAGKPRDQHVYDHAKESPWVMTVPLIVLASFAALCAVGGEGGPLYSTMARSEPASVAVQQWGAQWGMAGITLPSHADTAGVHAQAGAYALGVAFIGTLLAWLLYGMRVIDPADIKRQFIALHGFLAAQWRFDDFYQFAFIRPTHALARWCTAIDRRVFDGFLHGVAKGTVDVSRWDRRFDERIVDGLVNLLGDVTFGTGRALRRVQTGFMRQYVLFIAVGVLTLFVMLFVAFPK
ncbi:MAG: NADH-quinone oxidoreductase subunit L [Planctomycetaceae bacterium]